MTERIHPELRAASILAETQSEGAAPSAAAAGPSITIWLSNSGGYIALNWDNTGAIGKYDYVALYNHEPGGNPYGYLTNQWQWVTSASGSYVTGTSATGAPYWIAYCGWDYAIGAYEVVQTAGPTQP